MYIRGTVKEDASLEQETGAYVLEKDTDSYQMITTGKQAVKDFLFVRKGQKMEIEGKETGGDIYVEQAKIELQRNLEECRDKEEKNKCSCIKKSNMIELS